MVYSVYGSAKRDDGGAAIQLSELIGALSHALDMTEGQPAGHCIRCAWIGVHVGREMGMAEQDLADLYYTLLLKDLGCSSNAARICALYLTDDIQLKRGFKTIDGSVSAVLRFVISQTGVGAGLSERFRAVVNVVQNGGEIMRDLFETRCHRGADIARKMRFSETVQNGIRNLDEHWDGSGLPLNLKGNAIPVESSIALLAQVVDVFHHGQGRKAATKEVISRSGGWFAPEIVEAFRRVAQRTDFWEVLAGAEVEARVLELDPTPHPEPVDEGWLDDIAEAFADVVDAKSPYTADHSTRVTLYTDMIAEEMGLAEDHRRWLRRAALLHDIGKLAVSNSVLDKPGKLDEAEWASIKQHSWHSERVLERVTAFRDIAPIAGGHHERLDGKGYPQGLVRDEIPLETRILTVADVFDALSAERPYRSAMPIAKAMEILDRDTGAAFDAECVSALRRGLERVTSGAAAA